MLSPYWKYHWDVIKMGFERNPGLVALFGWALAFFMLVSIMSLREEVPFFLVLLFFLGLSFGIPYTSYWRKDRLEARLEAWRKLKRTVHALQTSLYDPKTDLSSSARAFGTYLLYRRGLGPYSLEQGATYLRYHGPIESKGLLQLFLRRYFEEMSDGRYQWSEVAWAPVDAVNRMPRDWKPRKSNQPLNDVGEAPAMLGQ